MNFGDGAVLTANYLQRKSDHPWLVRAKGEKPEDSKPFKAVIAKDVIFKESEAGSHERGFGCRMIAKCGSAVTFESSEQFDILKARRLVFSGFWFKDKQTNDLVFEVSELYLTTEGHMYYIAPVLETATEEKKEIAA